MIMWRPAMDNISGVRALHLAFQMYSITIIIITYRQLKLQGIPSWLREMLVHARSSLGCLNSALQIIRLDSKIARDPSQLVPGPHRYWRVVSVLHADVVQSLFREP